MFKHTTLILLVVSVALISACAPPARPVASHMLNVVEAAGLRETVEIEIAATDPDRGRHTTITDQAAIEEIIASLDTDLPLGLRTRCIEDYRLLFHLRDGTTQEFRYSAGEWGCLLLRGEQEFWQGGEAVPPEVFNQLIAE